MKTIAILAGAMALAFAGVAQAQTTGPSGQQDTNKPGMANPGPQGTPSSTDRVTGSGTVNSGTVTTGAGVSGSNVPPTTTPNSPNPAR